jgi:hypothetical protein
MSRRDPPLATNLNPFGICGNLFTLSSDQWSQILKAHQSVRHPGNVSKQRYDLARLSTTK